MGKNNPSRPSRAPPKTTSSQPPTGTKPKHAPSSTAPSTSSISSSHPPGGGVKRKAPLTALPTSTKKSNCPTTIADVDMLFEEDSQPEGVLSDTGDSQPASQPITTAPALLSGGSQSTSLPHTTAPSQTTSTPSPLHSSTSTQPSTTTVTSAHANLTDLSQVLAPDFIRKVYVQCGDSALPLSRINPILLAKCIDSICGKVASVQHLRSGGLYITCNTEDQVKTLIATKTFCISPDRVIPVSSCIALNTQSVTGKIYAPEFQEEPLPTLLDMLRPNGVVAIRRLFRDPKKSHIPLFVLTFLGTSRPSSMTVGYSKIAVDPYIPSPLRCYKCCRWGHSSTYCRGAVHCSRCGQKDHNGLSCENTPCCVNCGGAHESLSKDCPVYRREMDICHHSVTHNTTFPAARKYFDAQTTPSNPHHLSLTAAPGHQPPTLSSPPPHSTNPPPNTSTSPPHTSPPPHTTTPPPLFSHSNFPPLSHPPSLQASTPPPLSHSLPTPASPWLTQGQRSPAGAGSVSGPYTDPFADEPFLPSQLPPLTLTAPSPTPPDPYSTTLPPLSVPDSSPHATTHSATAHLPSHHPSTHTTLSASLGTQPGTPPTLPHWLLTLLPLLLRLFFASSLSARIECLLELGSHLHIESLMSSLLSDLGYSSFSSTQ